MNDSEASQGIVDTIITKGALPSRLQTEQFTGVSGSSTPSCQLTQKLVYLALS